MSLFPIFSPVARLTGLSLIANTNIGNGAANQTFTLPSGIQSGDLIIVANWGFNSTSGDNPIAVTPSGFTNVLNTAQGDGAAGQRSLLHYKLSDGGDSGAVITGMSAVQGDWGCYVIRGVGGVIKTVGTASPVTASEGGTGSPNSIVISNSGVAGPAVAVASYLSNDAEGFVSLVYSGATSDADCAPNDFRLLKHTKYALGGSPASITVDLSSTGGLRAEIIQGIYFTLR